MTEKVMCIIAGTLLACMTMVVACTIHRDNIPENRMAYCIDHGKSYEWDMRAKAVTCK